MNEGTLISGAGEKWSVAGGPDEWSTKRLQLWRKGNLFDLEVKCAGMPLIKASKVDLAVYSGYFQTFFDSQFPDASKCEVNIEGAEPAVLETIIKALYEKEILLTFENAAPLIALSDRLQIDCVVKATEKFLISHLSFLNAVENLILAGMYHCQRLREASLAMATCNFDRIPLEELAVLSFNDYLELISSSKLPLQQESHLYEGIKLWATSKENSISPEVKPSELTDMLLAMIGQIKFQLCPPSEMARIFADPWLIDRPALLSAIAIRFTNTIPAKPNSPRNRMGKIVRFKGWSSHLARAKRKSDRVHSVASEKFTFIGSSEANTLWEVVLYPYGRHDPVDNLALFLGALAVPDAPSRKFRFTIVNQRSPEHSISTDRLELIKANNWSWWGRNSIGVSTDITRSFVLEDTLMISIVQCVNS